MKKLIIAPFIAMAAASAFAVPITLYTQPDAQSTKLTQIDSSQVKPFFTQGDWTKVGDAATGQVGWIENKSAQTSMNNAKVNQQIAGVQAAQKEARQAKAQFDQQYRQTMQVLNQKQQALTSQLGTTQQPNTNSKSSLTETLVSYSGNGSDGKVHITEKWTNKDGKLETKTYDMPVQEYNKQHMVQNDNFQQRMIQQRQQMNAYMNQMMRQMSQQFGSFNPNTPTNNSSLSTGNKVLPTQDQS